MPKCVIDMGSDSPLDPVEPPQRVVHVIRMRTAGGGVLAALRIAGVEIAAGRAVQVWCVIEEEFSAVSAMADRCGVPVGRISQAKLIQELLATNLRRRFEVVHLHSGLDTISDRVTDIRRLLSGRIPLVVWLHGSGDLAEMGAVARSRHRQLSRLPDAIVVPSDSQRDEQVGAGVSASRVHVVPVVVPRPRAIRGALRKRLGLVESTRVVLFCGRLVPLKNPILTIEAFQSVAGQHPDAVLLVAGDGELASACAEMAASSDQIRLLGHVDEVDGLYVDADIFVSVSVTESFGITAVEAVRGGVPCVLSRIRPWSDFFREGVGVEFVDDISSPNETAQILDRLLSDEQLRQRASASQELANALFSSDSAAAELDLIYRTIFQKVSTPGSR